MKLRTKMMAMVSGVAMVTLGLGCAEESASPADSTANGEAVGGAGDAADSAADSVAGGSDVVTGDTPTSDAAGAAVSGDSAGDDTASGDGADAAGPKIEGFGGKTYSIISTNTLGNGIVIDDLHIGEGDPCPKGATVTIEYHGTLADGTVFDSTRQRGAGGPWPLARLIQGWQEGVPGMKVGGVRRLTIPYQLGYGEMGSPPTIPAKAELTFVIEMVSFK